MDTNLNNQNDSGEEAVPAKKDGNGKETSLDNINDNDEKIILNKGNDNVRKNVLGRKNDKNFLETSVVTVLIILIFATVSVIGYLPIRNAYFPVKDNVKNYMEDSGTSGMAYDIARLTEHLQRFVNRTDNWPSDRYANIKSVKYKIYPLVEDENPEQISENSTGEDRENTDVEGDSGRETSIDMAENEIDEKTTAERKQNIAAKRRSLTNMPGVSDGEFQEEVDNSLLYIKITFDEKGQPAVESVLGDVLEDKGTRFNKNLIARYLETGGMEGYANLEAIYIIPQDFESYNDAFTLNMKENHVFPDYTILILIIGAAGILILIIAAFAIPYSSQNKTAICRGFNKMSLELKLAAWVLLIGLCGINVAVLDSHSYGYINPVTRIVYDVNPHFYVIGIPITFMLYLLIYLGAVYIKYVYYTGFREGLINNSFLGKTSVFLIKETGKMLNRLMAIDLREDNQRRLIGIAVMNFLAIIVLGSGGHFGFILAVIYSVVVFKYILGLIENAAELNLASEQVSAGNFDIKVDEDMGILAPIAQNLNNIKQGFSLAVDKKIKSERMKSELISNVSHDLKTPLTSIITYVDLLKDGDIEPDTQKEYIDIIDKKSQRLKMLIEDLFEASKATSGNMDLNLEDIDIIALFRQTLGEMEEKINESDLQFKINAPEGRVICNLDGRRTYRVFENIMSNILKYSMENSRVYIDAVQDEHKVSFTFKNISAHEMNFDPSVIAERFTRGDESRSTEGSGLGLSIAKSLVELQGGNLDIIIDGDLFKLIVIFPTVH
ncbi:MAG: sensor histidine kinase [Candidatus Alkaliphilus sp. MAG34]